jgi:DNA topoisomerase IB
MLDESSNKGLKSDGARTGGMLICTVAFKQASEPSRQPSEPENKEIKWTTLEHAGVLFPPEYTRLPDNVKLLYQGQPVELTAEQVRASPARA